MISLADLSRCRASFVQLCGLFACILVYPSASLCPFDVSVHHDPLPSSSLRSPCHTSTVFYLSLPLSVIQRMPCIASVLERRGIAHNVNEKEGVGKTRTKLRE